MITAASPDSALTRDLDKHDSGGAHNKGGGALIGLEYLVEIKEVRSSLVCRFSFYVVFFFYQIGQASRPSTLCLLCNNKELPFGNVINHLTSATHRLNYLEAFFPIVSRKFSKVPTWKEIPFESILCTFRPGAILDNNPSQMLKIHSDQVPNLKLWQAASFQYLQSVVGRIGGLLYFLGLGEIMAPRSESKCGRLNPWSVEGRAPINNHLKQVATASIPENNAS